MKMVKKIIAAALALGMVGIMFAGCSSAKDSQSVAKIKEQGYITMYTNAAFPPFEYVDGQDVKGVDVEIGLAIAQELGVQLKVENVAFDSIISGISSGKAAFGAAGITITDERKQSADFSKDYYTSVQYIIMPADANYASLADLAGKNIGVQLGTTGDFLVSDAVNGTDDDKGQHEKGALEGTGATVKQYANGLDASQDLLNGKIDAVVLDKLPSESIVSNNTGALKCAAVSDADPESYGICVAKGNTELLDTINSVLDKLISEGKIDQFVLAHSSVQ